jgi:hypothetical protein
MSAWGGDTRSDRLCATNTSLQLFNLTPPCCLFSVCFEAVTREGERRRHLYAFEAERESKVIAFPDGYDGLRLALGVRSDRGGET